MGKAVPLAVFAIGLCVAGCAPDTPEPVEAIPERVPTTHQEAVDVVPEFIPGGSARDNLPYIHWVLTTGSSPLRGQEGVSSGASMDCQHWKTPVLIASTWKSPQTAPHWNLLPNP